MNRAFLGVCLVLGCGAAAAVAAQPVTPEQALLDSIKQGPLAKLGPWLINLHEEYQRYASSGKKKTPADFRSSDPLLQVRNGFVAIEGVANDPAALRLTLNAIGATQIRGRLLFSAMVPVDQLARLGRDRALRSARPVMAKTRAMPLPIPVQGQGVVSLFGQGGNASDLDGSGVRVGVLSDSYNCEPGPFLPGAPTSTVDEDQTNGELPADVVVADNGACPGTDEGRAIMQIVHDIAPGAGLAFHTAFNGRFDFACGILELAGIDTPGAAAACGAVGVDYSPQSGDSATA